MPIIEAPPEIYRTSTLLSAMVNLPRASVFLRDKLFSKVVASPTDQVDISFYKGKAELGALLRAGIRPASPRPANASNFGFSARRTSNQSAR